MRLTSCLLATLLLIPTTTQAKDHEDIVLLVERPILVRMHLSIKGVAHHKVWDGFLKFLFKSLDRNKDVILDKTESQGMPTPVAQFVANQSTARRIYDYFVTKDKNQDGKVTFEEMKSYYLRKGSTAFRIGGGSASGRVVYQYLGYASSNVTASQVNQAILKLLDSNKDGKLSAKEMENAEARMLKNDFDDDEMLTMQEVIGQATPATGGNTLRLVTRAAGAPSVARDLVFPMSMRFAKRALGKKLIERYTKRKNKSTADHLTREEIGLSREEFRKLDTARDGRLTSSELGEFASRKPDLVLRVDIGKSAKPQIVDSRKPIEADVKRALVRVGVTELSIQNGGTARSGAWVQFARQSAASRAQFNALDRDNNGYVDKDEARVNNFYRSSFARLDADNDGKIFLKEVLAFQKATRELTERSKNSCISLNVSSDDRGLFGLLDRDGDQRLSVRELREAVRQIKKLDRDNDQKLALNEIPRRFQLSFVRGPSMTNAPGIQNVVFAAPTMGRSLPKPRTEGPIWFRKMDRNRDGDVSPREFLGKPEVFKKLDLDKDRLLSADEATKAQQAFRQK